jgi:RNA polymerase sigma factor (sigma-70 family)
VGAVVKREFATDMAGLPKQMRARPDTPMEALMASAPNEPIETSQLELLALRDVLADAIDALPDRLKFVFELSVIERRPIRNIAKMMNMSKSHVWKLVQQAKDQLADELQDNPAIAAYLRRHDDEDEE